MSQQALRQQTSPTCTCPPPTCICCPKRRMHAAQGPRPAPGMPTPCTLAWPRPIKAARKLQGQSPTTQCLRVQQAPIAPPALPVPLASLYCPLRGEAPRPAPLCWAGAPRPAQQ